MSSPTDTVEARLARLEAIDEIRQLAPRYALALDTRNIPDLAGLFVEDVRVGNGEVGREAMERHWHQRLARFYTSVHFVGNHIIDMQDENTATGVVYCRAEHEIMGRWVIVLMQYWDHYARRDGRWYFRKRKPIHWLAVDWTDRPLGELKSRWPDRPQSRAELPAAWPSWDAFWSDKPNPSGAAPLYPAMGAQS